MTRAPLGLLVVAALLGGCEWYDPFQRPGAWRPTGANEANLRAMVGRPADLTFGAQAEGSDGHLAADAVDRLREDRVRRLPITDIARIGNQGQGQSQ